MVSSTRTWKNFARERLTVWGKLIIEEFGIDEEDVTRIITREVDYASRAGKNDGNWFFVDYLSRADKKIFFVDYASQADIIIFFAEYSSRAGWKKKEKMHLFY